MNARPFVQALLALALLAASDVASAGRIHPDLQKRLSQKAAGDLTPVIVELEDRVSPSAVGAGAPERDRRARGRAVVKALKDHAERTQKPIRAQLAQEDAADARNVQPLWVVNAIALEASEKVIDKLANRPDVREVRIDRSIPPPRPRATVKPKSGGAPPAWNLEQIRAPQVWALGHSGTGIVVGSFDTGVDGTHPDLVPNYRGNHAISWFDPYNQHDEPYDNNGHGTHTTGTMVAGGEFSGFRIGVAPGARWIAAKGWTDGDNATASAFHRIFEWFLAPGGDPDNAPDVVNSSWGMDPPSCDPEFVTDVQALRAAGIVPVFASGNSGPDPSTTLAPGSYGTSFTVGATGFDDEIAEFSSQGPSQCDGAVKPDVSAPGVAILSTLPGAFHFELDGTSMAAPHVSGAAAVLRSIVPTLTVEEIEAAIVDGAVDQGPPGPDNAFGAGRLDLLQSASLVLGIPIVGIEASASASEAGLAPGSFTVRRRGSTATALVVPYTVAGTATPGSDYVALPGSVTIPAGASSAVIEVTPLDDAVVELTETVVVTLTPNPAYLASPAQATVDIASDELLPDLTLSAFTVQNAGGAGSPLTLNETTRNLGPGASEASTTGYYISSNATLDAGDTLIGTRAVPALAAGATSAASVSVTLPAGLATGTWFIVAKTDHADQLVEAQEANNVASRSLLVGPDLAVSAITVPAMAGAGLAIELADTTRNSGGGTSPASTTSYYLSSDSIFDPSDVLLGSRAVPALAAGATHAGSVSATIPAATAAGTYQVIARADAAAAVAETIESNNTMFSVVRIGPDLTVSALTVPGTAGAGSTISITETTRNAGGGSSPASVTRYYLSTDVLLGAADVVVGARTVPTLGPGASDTATLGLVIPASTPSGTYYLIAAADADAAVAETTETNNTNYRSLVLGSDLAVFSLTVPAIAGAGLPLAVSDTTRNQGAGTAPASTTSYYLSSNTSFDASDTLIGSRAVAALAQGASDAGSAVVTIPAGTAAGTWYLFARADAGDVVPESSESNNTTFSAVRVGPDLTVSALTVPGTAGAGSTISITETTRNAGGGSSATSVTRYYLSADTVPGAGDVVVGARTVPALAPSASDTATLGLVIPASTPSGTYYLIAAADADATVAEPLETNNTNYRSLVLGSDLAVSSLTVPATGGAGLPLTVSDTTRNQGAGTAPASTTSYYLSANTSFDAADTLLGSRSVAALAQGASDTGSAAVTIPAGTGAGTWYLFARADATGVVPESSESNNTAFGTVRIGPDLTVSALTVPGTGGAGSAISITETTRNAGGGSSATSVTRYYLSADTVPGAGDVVVGARTVPTLAPGASDTATLGLVIPAGTPSGTYYLIAAADADASVAEPVETNNTASRSLVVGTDLIVATFNTPAAGGAGATLTVSDTTRNQGAGTAPASTTSYYLSANASYEASDTLLGSRSIASLAPGTSDTGSAVVTIPAGIAPGTWYLLARADATEAVPESSESNNVAYRSIAIGPDIVVSSLTAPAAAGAGETISVTVVTRNAGAGTAAASSTQVWYSEDWTLGAGDVLLATVAVPALAAGATDTDLVAVTLPATAPAGTRYLLAVGDSAGAVPETLETNNSIYRSLLVGADLVVGAFTVPSAGGAGLALTLADTTRNAGGGAAPATTTRYYLSLDATPDAADLLLGSRAVPPLASGAGDSATVEVAIPAGTATGTYYVLMVVDADNVAAETYENNNRTNRSLYVGPDLTVTSLLGPPGAAAGSAITFTDTTKNAGGGAAPASVTRYYLSADGTPSAGDVLLGSRAVPALDPGATATGDVTVTIPAGTASGTWYVFAVADADGVVPEIYDSNNYRGRSLSVAP